jgi:hypothetical protein
MQVSIAFSPPWIPLYRAPPDWRGPPPLCQRDPRSPKGNSSSKVLRCSVVSVA